MRNDVKYIILPIRARGRELPARPPPVPALTNGLDALELPASVDRDPFFSDIFSGSEFDKILQSVEKKRKKKFD